MNGKFVEKYGESWKEMDSDMKMMVIVSEIFDLREEIKPMKETCKIVSKHSIYFKAVAIVSGIVVTGILGWLVSSVLSVIK